MVASTAGATASITFNGTSIRWIGSRGRNQGIATMSIDGVLQRTVDTFARPADEAHTSVATIYDLSRGPHTLKIQVMNTDGSYVVVDAFDTHP